MLREEVKQFAAKATKLVEDLTHEVEELTSELIAAKLGQAELANAGMMLAKEKREVEKQARAAAPAPRRPHHGSAPVARRLRLG